MGWLQQQKFIFIHRGLDKEDMLHIYNGILLSHKKEGNGVICSNIDGPRDYLSEVNQKDLKNDANEQTHRFRTQTSLPKGEGGREG